MKMNIKRKLLHLGLLSAGLLLTFETNAQVSFASATNYAVGHGPYSAVAADVNGDGKVDLISANYLNSSVTVLTNNGNGILSSNASYSTSGQPFFMISADVNGDGNADLITATANVGRLTVLTNNGNGGFALASTPGVGSNPQSVFAADVNGDGKVDLIAANFASGAVNLNVLTNADSGNFALASSFGDGSAAYSVVGADVNGDRKTDLICLEVVKGGASTSCARVFTNDGSGTFGLCSSNNIITKWPGLAATADVDGDGKVDLIVPDYSSGSGTNVYVFTNNGNGVFSSNATYVVSKGPYGVIAVDINGDGKLDLISANIFSTLTVLTNNGSGLFGLNATLNVGSLARQVVAADLNGDGKLDLISANGQVNTLSVLFNTSTFPLPTSTPSLNINPSGNRQFVSWPSASAGWSLQQSSDLTTSNWNPSGYNGYPIYDDGTNKSLTVQSLQGNLFFRLLHP